MPAIQDKVQRRFGHYPERILQFGEGNFLRAFVDWMIDKANRDGIYQGSIVLCQAIEGGDVLRQFINEQEGLYTLVMRGAEEGRPVEQIETISSVSRCINAYSDYQELMKLAASPDLEVVVSNTTEAGISYHAGDKLEDRPPFSFPAKVCAFLYARYQAFDRDPERRHGLLFLPVELIDNNGAELRRIVLQYARDWELEADFCRWVEEANHFTSTLVDRIVTGYPRDEAAQFSERLGYEDKILDTSELFNLWVIEGDEAWADKLPVHRTDANVIWTRDVRPYKKRKVRILNGAHTATVLAAYLAGFDHVLDFMQNEAVRSYMNRLLHEEVIPVLDLPREELETFAAAVNDRFANPYIKHKLLDISLNSCSKFNARCLPSLLEFVEQKGQLPRRLVFALAALIRFYKIRRQEDGRYQGQRSKDGAYPVRDDQSVLDFFAQIWAENLSAEERARRVLSKTDFWSGRDLSAVPGLCEAVAADLEAMEERDMHDLLKDLA